MIFSIVLKTGMISGWPNQQRDGGDFGTRTRARGFVHIPRYVESSVTRRLASLRLYGAQKNDLRVLWPCAIGLVRPTCTPGARSVLWRHAHLSGGRGAARSVPQLRKGEARGVGVPGGQSVLYQALCLLRGAALPPSHHQGHCRGTQSSLGNDQDAGEAVHACAACQSGHAGTQGHRHRRDLDPQGPHLPHRGERSDSKASDLVRGRRPQRGEHDAVLRLAGREEDAAHSLGGDGHVETVLQRDRGARAAGGDPLRQVSHHEPSGRCARRSAQVRVQQTQWPGSKLHQGSEVHAAFASREPYAEGPAGAQDAAGGKQTLEYGVSAQGVLRSALGLRARGLGAAILRELACEPEVAAPRTLRKIRSDDRSALGWNRRLLQAREQSLARIRGRLEQQDPCYPATCIWAARRRIPAAQNSHLHAPRALI